MQPSAEHLSLRDGAEEEFDPARQAQFILQNEGLHRGLATEALAESLLKAAPEAVSVLEIPASESDRRLLASILLKGEEELSAEILEAAVRALRRVLEAGKIGDSYTIGASNERTNLEVVTSICGILDQLRPEGAPHKRLITLVADRPGHDRRYAIDPSKIRRELGWRPRETFETGLRKTIEWYLANEAGWCSLLEGRYRGERLGAAA